MNFENSKKVFFRETFSKINLNKSNIAEKEFENCIFENCSFIETTFQKCSFTDCIFNNCVLSAIQANLSTFSEVQFNNSKVIGFDWTKAKSLRHLEFQDSQLTYSNFKLLKLPHLKIINCLANEVDFSGCDLTEANFSNSDLEKSRFLQTNLTKTNFTKTFNYSIDFKINKLKKTIFSMPEAISLLDSLDIILGN